MGQRFAGGIYLDLILAAVAYRQEVDIAAAFSGAESGAFANLFAELRVEILSAVVGFALLSAFTAIWTGMLRDRMDAAAPDFDRPLSEPERVFLRDACDALADRFSEPAPSWRQQLYPTLAIFALAAAPLALMSVAFFAEARIAARYDADIAARLTRLIRADIAEAPAP